MACSKFDKIEKLQKKLDEMTSDPALANELINREMGQIDKNTALNMAREEGEAKGMAIGEAKGRVEGRAEGRAEGRYDEKNTIAKQLLLINMPVNQISAVTGLSEEEINKLKN